jgi:hypothetical protein
VFDLIDQDDDGDIDRFNNDRVDGVDVQSSYPGDTVTVNLPNGSVTYTGITFYLADGREVFTPTDGGILQTGTFAGSSAVSGQGSLDVSGPDGGDLGPPCLTPGVLIDTAKGACRSRPDPGAMIDTMDRGYRPVLWVGRSDLRADPKHAPVRFEKPALSAIPRPSTSRPSIASMSAAGRPS